MTYPLEVWSPLQFNALNENFHSLSYDLYGRGQSSFTNGILSTASLSRQAMELMDALRIYEPIHIVSLSNADWIAIDMASRATERVASVSLIAPSGNDNRTLNASTRMFSKLSWLHPFLNASIRKRLHQRMTKHSQALPKSTQDCIFDVYDISKRSVIENPNFTKAFWSQVANAPTKTQADGLVKSIPAEIPIQLLRFAEEKDSTLEGIAPLLQHPNCQDTLFERGGHMALLENSEQIWPRLLDFWNSTSKHS